MIKNKKGSLQDIIMIAVLLLVFSMGILIVAKISNEINTKIQDSSTISRLTGAADAKNAMGNINSLFPGVIDNSFLFLAIGLAVVAIVLAMLVAFHPVFFFFYFIMLIIVIFISGIFSNIYQQMAETAALSATADQLIFISHIMTYLPFFVGILGFLLSIIMYKTYQERQ